MSKESTVITAAEVAKHNTDGDAWIIVDKYVYDVSKFAKLHPGGKSILMKYAGQDGTEVFREFHNDSVMQKYHKRLCIGTLAEADQSPARPVHMADFEFGDMVPYGDPAWYQRFPSSPYYKETHRQWRAKVRNMVETHLIPRLGEFYDFKHKTPPLDISTAFGSAGMLSVMCGQPYPAEHAPCPPPADYDYFHELIAHDEVSRCAQAPIIAAFTNGPAIALSAINAFGTPALRSLCCPPVLRGEAFIALAISEPTAGSDVAGLACRGVKSACGTYYTVTGTKKWITNGMYARWFVTAVRTSDDPHRGLTFMVIDSEAEGVAVRKVDIRNSDISGTAYITFEGVRVPAERVVGKEGDGFRLIMHNFNHERWYITVMAVRLCRVAIESCIRWAMRRKTFGVPLHKHQAVRMRIATMARQTEALAAWLESLTWQMCNLPHGEAMMRLGDQICLMKAHASKVYEQVASCATHVLGGMALDGGGVMRHVESAVAAVKGYQIPGGAEDVMEDFAARQAFRWAKMSARI